MKESKKELNVKRYVGNFKENNNTFIENYSNHLRQIEIAKASNPYQDPDAVSTNNKEFYDALVSFLKKRKKEFLKEKKEESVNPFIKNIDFKYFNKKIKVFSVDTSKFQLDLTLTSDQFGFSAPHIEQGKLFASDDTPSSHYPYAKFIGFSSNKDEAIQLVANTIYDARTIGGSFLWPIKNGGSFYNLHRGCRSYIEDCVDLTLLEIKHFYIILAEYQKRYGNLATPEVDIKNFMAIYQKHYSNNILLKYNDKEVIIKWLTLFRTFKEYIDFFKFDDFVDESSESIIDIMASDIEKNKLYSLETDTEYDLIEIKKVKGSYPYIIEHNIGLLSKNERDILERIIKNIRALTIQRTIKIQEILDKLEV